MAEVEDRGQKKRTVPGESETRKQRFNGCQSFAEQVEGSTV
jgi:hypothetical protein